MERSGACRDVGVVAEKTCVVPAGAWPSLFRAEQRRHSSLALVQAQGFTMHRPEIFSSVVLRGL
jgi:hypothetical protein